MPVRITAYLPEGAAERATLVADGVYLIGRGEDCALRIEHPSVSRRHAELVLGRDTWSLRDLGSKNGTFVGGRPADGVPTHGTSWIRMGDVACEVAWIDEADAARLRDDAIRRHDAVTALTLGLGREPRRPDLLQATLDAIIDLAGAERGLLLLPEGGDWLPVARRGFAPGEADGARFAGSRTAIARAAASRKPVVVHDLALDGDLGARQSVVDGGLRALACLPLVLGDEVLGLAYADSRTPGTTITRIDLELLETFAEHAALWLTTCRNQAAIDAVPIPAGDARGSP
jgi:hypothetical protein